MTTRPHRAVCRSHREALVAFVDRRERTARSTEALDHLERCPACAAELSETALAIAALRRLRREVEGVEPPADDWERLVARVRRPNPAPWRWPMTLAGIVTSTLLVAVLVSPLAVRGPAPDEPELASGPPSWAIPSRADRQLEAEYLWISRQPTVSAPTRLGVPVFGPRGGPDGIRISPQQKEVGPTTSSGLAPRAS